VAVLIKVALAPTMAELLVSFTDPLIDPVIVWPLNEHARDRSVKNSTTAFA
jgi:hypothetical protein